MTRTESLVVRSAVVWTVLVWSVFGRNLIGDDEHSTGFKVVHLTLAVVSVGFAVAIWRVATRSRREAAERAGTSS